MKFHPVLALSLALMLPTAMHAAFSYTVTDLGTFGGNDSYALAVNNLGQAVGFARLPNGYSHSFAYVNGTMIDLGTLGGDSLNAAGINDRGEIVGDFSTPNGDTHACVFSFCTGTMTDLGTLGGTYSTAAAINNHGIIVGSAGLASGPIHAFAYVNGTMIDLGTLGGDASAATAIDDNDVIVGNSDAVVSPPWQEHVQGFVFIDGQMLNLSIFGGILDNNSTAPIFPSGVSDSGVVGSAYPIPLGIHGPEAFICYPGQPLIDFGGASTAFGIACGINARGQVVGYYGDATHATPPYATLYSDGVNYNLNTLVDLSTSDFTELMEAMAISNNGYIVGDGIVQGGNVHAFLLTPNRHRH